MSVAFIGLGLNNERGLTIEGLEEARRSSNVFAEFYTNIMPGLDRRKLELLLGKTVTLAEEPGVPGSLLDSVRDNKTRGLHTLILLDVKPELSKQLAIGEAATKLVTADPALGSWLGIGVARIGSEDQFVLSAKLGKLQNQDFGKIPHSLVIPGRLHFMEVESLKAFGGASDADLEALK